MLQKSIASPHSVRRLALALVTLLAIGAGCGKAEKRDTGEFEPYVASFESAAQAHGHPLKVDNIAIHFGTVDSTTERAYCEVAGGETPTITVSQEAWSESTDAEREELIFHELGHCVLRRKHVEGADSSGAPISMMNPYAIPSDIFVAKQTFYLDELFQVSGEF